MSDQEPTTLTLTVSKTIRATPEQAYRAWIDPAVMSKFMAGGDTQTVVEARTDPFVGGAFFVLMRGETDVPHKGKYLVLNPFSQMTFTWESPYSLADSVVDLRFAPVAAGCEVTLTHTKFISQGARDGHEKGWARILSRLEALFITV